MANIQLNDYGTVFEITLVDAAGAPVDVSTATLQEIIFRKPDGTEETKTSTFETDGSDGKIKYTTVNGDLDVAGPWQLQGHVTLPTGDWRSAKGSFEVRRNV